MLEFFDLGVKISDGLCTDQAGVGHRTHRVLFTEVSSFSLFLASSAVEVFTGNSGSSFL